MGRLRKSCPELMIIVTEGGALGIWNLREKKFSKIIQWGRCWGNLDVWTINNKLRNDRIWFKSILSRGCYRSSVRRTLWGAHLGGKLRSSRDKNFRDCFMRVVWLMLICRSNNFKDMFNHIDRRWNSWCRTGGDSGVLRVSDDRGTHFCFQMYNIEPNNWWTR